jgi:hypothetical protein
MTDPWCWYIIYGIYATVTKMGYIDGIHGTPYIAAPWIQWVRNDGAVQQNIIQMC